MQRDLEKRPMKKRHNASRMIIDPYVGKETYRFTKRDIYMKRDLGKSPTHKGK